MVFCVNPASPGPTPKHKFHWKVTISMKIMNFTHFDEIHRFAWKSVDFIENHDLHGNCDFIRRCEGSRNYSIPICLLRFSGCHFLQNHSFHRNHGFLLNSRISVKISGFHGNSRFSRKCGSRRKWHLKNINKCLGISCFSTPATRKAGFPWKTWKPAKMTENTEILRFHQKREKGENRGEPGKRESAGKGGPNPAPHGAPCYRRIAFSNKSIPSLRSNHCKFEPL